MQKGGVPVSIIIGAVVVLALLGGGYFYMQSKGGGGIPGLPGAVGLNPNCKYNDPDLCKFVNNWKTLKDYSIKSTSSYQGQKSDISMQISGEDKSHIVMSQSGKESFNVITIGDTTYTKDFTDNKWWKQKASKQEAEIKDKYTLKFDESDKETEDKTTYKSLGKEPCGNLTCFKYEVINPEMAGTQEFIWFDTNQYLLRKMVTKSKEGETEMTFDYSGVNITAPSPTKDAKDNQFILPTGGSIPGMSQQELDELKKASEDAQKMMQNYNIPTGGDDSEN